MNHCGIQQSSNFSSFGNGEPVVCPKPRRLSHLNAAINDPVRPFRLHMCYQQDPYESKSGPELLDVILAKGGGYGAPERTITPTPSSPPFFCGSPPSRVSNPLIQDARFGDDNISPISPLSMIPNPNSVIPSSSSSPSPSPSPSPSSSSRKTGYLRPNYGNKPLVRIEGFNCLDRDNRRHCSIPALA